MCFRKAAVSPSGAVARKSNLLERNVFMPGSSPQVKSTNFLATRVLPVDAYKVRNSLFLSVRLFCPDRCVVHGLDLLNSCCQQLLRTPAAADVNVLENEDAARMFEEERSRCVGHFGWASSLFVRGQVQGHGRC